MLAHDALPVDERGAAYLDAAASRVVIFDGAMGTNLQLAGLDAQDFGGPALEGCNEALVLSRPDVVAGVHSSFLSVGVDVIETNAFGAFGIVLAEYGLENRVTEINLAAARIARDAVDSVPSDGRPRWVAGNLGPGTRFPTLGQIPYYSLRDGYQEAAAEAYSRWGRPLVIETVQDVLQAKAAIIGARRAMADAGRELAVQVQVTIETTGRMLMGSEIGAALTTLDALRPDVIGLNCATGPAEMGEHLRYLSAPFPLPLSCLPNAGLPSVVEGKMHYDLTPSQLAEHHTRFVTELGVNVIGGCCGTTPGHLKAVVAFASTCAGTGRRLRARARIALHPRPLRPGTFGAQHRRTHERERLQAFPRRHAGQGVGRLHLYGQGPVRFGAPRARCVRRLHRRRRRRRHDRNSEPFCNSGDAADNA